MWQLARSPEKRGCQAFFQRTPPARQPNRIGKEWQNSREIVGTLVFWQSEWRAGYPEGCPSQLAELGWQVWLRGATGALLRSYQRMSWILPRHDVIITVNLLAICPAKVKTFRKSNGLAFPGAPAGRRGRPASPGSRNSGRSGSRSGNPRDRGNPRPPSRPSAARA